MNLLGREILRSAFSLFLFSLFFFFFSFAKVCKWKLNKRQSIRRFSTPFPRAAGTAVPDDLDVLANSIEADHQ